MAKKGLTIIVRARNLLSSGLKSAGASVRKFASGIARAGKAAVMGLLAVGGAIAAIAAKTIAASNIQDAAEAKLRGALKATGGAAGLTVSELKKYAAELQKTKGVGDEITLSTMGMLATFKNIKGDTFKEASAAILDMGAAMGKAGKGSADIEAQAIQVGKALNDPINGISALTRVGVMFTDKQKDQIKVMQESGDIAGAQAIILKELQGEFGGVANEVYNSNKSLTRLKLSFGDLMESIGKTIKESTVFDGVISSLSDTVEKFAESGYIELWAENIVSAINFVLPVLGKLGNGFDWVKSQIAGASAFWGAIAGGDTIDNAVKAMDEIPAMLKKEENQRLKNIKALKEEKRIKKEAEEKEDLKKQQQQKTLEESDFWALSKAELKAIEAAKDKKLALEKKFHDDLAKLQEEKRAVEERDAKAALDLIDEKIEKQKGLAGITVKEFIAKANQQKAVDKQQQDDSDRANKIRAKEDRGIRVSRKDKEFINAFNAIELANKDLVKLKAERAAAVKVVEGRAKEQLRATKEISSEIGKLKATLVRKMEAIMRGG